MQRILIISEDAEELSWLREEPSLQNCAIETVGEGAAVSNTPENPIGHIEYREAHGMRPGGFGIMLTKQLVDEVIYNEIGNEVLLIKHRC